MTFNLLSAGKLRRTCPWHLRRPGIARLFEILEPDIVGTQEANRDQLDELIALLPDYGCIAHGNLGPDLVHDQRNWYCATFYRRDRVAHVPGADDVFWLSPRPEIPASQFTLGTRPRLVTWSTFEHRATGRTLVFGTTHLEALLADHRRRSVRLLRAHVARTVRTLGDDVPVFLTGDFNAGARSAEIRALSDAAAGTAGLCDAWAHCGPESQDDGATFQGLGWRDRLLTRLLGPRRIDYVFFRGRLSVRSVQRHTFDHVLGRGAPWPSDHFPVLAEFSLVA